MFQLTLGEGCSGGRGGACAGGVDVGHELHDWFRQRVGGGVRLTDDRFWAVWIPLYYGTIFAAEHPAGIGLSVLLVIWCLVGVHVETGSAGSGRNFWPS